MLDQLDLFSDTVHDECGVFGIYAPGEAVAKLTYYGLYALQHRGQESAGIAVSDGDNTMVFKDMGLVSQVFTERDLTTLHGHIAIGHVRYSTTGATNWENAQPIHKANEYWSLSLAHNGNLINTNELRRRLERRGSEFQSTSDSEVIAELVVRADRKTVEASVRDAVRHIKGAYSIVMMTEEKLIGVRDPYGVRPLALGVMNGHYVLSSETCGLDVIGADFLREVLPGEMVVIDDKGLASYQLIEQTNPSLCIFEFVYLARPDSSIYGRNVAEARKNMGRELAREAPVEADLVIPVPDSGNPAAQGYAQESGIPYGEGFVKNRYIGRTFIQPSQTIRQLGIRLKLNPLRDVIEGKRLVVVDDSIVRGNTSKKIVQMLRKAGAKEVHMRVSSPPIEWPCFYGIDTAERKDLIAANLSVERIRNFLGADSVKYISHQGLVRAVTGLAGDKVGQESDFCMACFDGQYPIPIPSRLKITKLSLEKAKKAETLF